MDLLKNFENVVDAVKQNNVFDDAETYIGADGLQHCTMCDGARQFRVEIFDPVRIVPCLCKCMAEKQERAVREKELADRSASLRKEAFVEREMQNWNFDKDDEENLVITHACKQYVEHFEDFRKNGKGILFYGNTGTGKTFYAACIANALIDKGIKCIMTTPARLVDDMTNGVSVSIFLHNLVRCPLVVIDDLGTERETSFMNEKVMMIIDTLYKANVPMIITTNFTPAQLISDTDIRRKRIADRLLQCCHPIVVKGESRRKDIGREEYKKTKDILGI